MIGLALGVTSGSGFTTLLVALSFHQFFEGFAIGSAAVGAGLGAAQAAAMGLAFSATTPAGIAMGGPLRPAVHAVPRCAC
jgi:zinc transporter 1/2/3